MAAIAQGIFHAKQIRPHPQTRGRIKCVLSYPYRFALGQLGHLGQTAESIANRAFSICHLHIYVGTALGHGGTLHFQDVSGQAKGRKCDPVAVLLGRPRRSYAAFSLAIVIRSQPRPSIPAGSLVRVVGQGRERFAAPQPFRVRCIGSAGDNFPANSRQASAAVSQLGTFRTAPPVIATPFG